jgi:hypothetical protein
MPLKILDIDRAFDGPDSEIVSLVGEVVGDQISVAEFAQIGERLCGEDYTIAERFFPSLRHLYDIVKSQKDDSDRIKMTVQLATTMRYAVWERYCLSDLEPSVRAALKDCSRLFLDTCFLIKEVDDKRYLMMGVAAALGDADAAKVLHDLGSGNLTA